MAWLLAQGDDIAPIPGTKRVARVEENTAADAVELSAEQIHRLNDLTPATGERHDETIMAAQYRSPCIWNSRGCPGPLSEGPAASPAARRAHTG